MERTIAVVDLALRSGQLQDADEGLRRLEANLEAARRRLDNLTVKAPVPGQITSLKAELGQSKAAGERLGQIDSSQGFKATAFIEEAMMGRVAVRENGNFEMDGNTYQLVLKKIFPVKTEKPLDEPPAEDPPGPDERPLDACEDEAAPC